jgi:hypothetical protein
MVATVAELQQTLLDENVAIAARIRTVFLLST